MAHEDMTLVELDKINNERLQKLITDANQLQIPLNIPNFRENYVVRLLEHLAGDQLERIQHDHAVSIAHALDDGESVVRRSRILKANGKQN